MKKIATVLAFLIVVGGIAAPGFAEGQDDKGGKVLKIGLSIPTFQEERWVRDRDTMEAYCKELGITCLTQIADMDAKKQQAQCENLISQGIKVLIISPHDGSAAAAIVDEAVKSGVKVISYDRLIRDTPNLDLYISFDNEKVGELQGKYFAEHVAKGNIVFLSGDPKDNNAVYLKKGASKYIMPKVDSGDYKIITEQPCNDWKAEEAMKHTENALTKANNNIVGVLAANDGTAGGAIQALAAAGLAGKAVVTGQDAELAAAQRIVKGEQSMTVFKDTRELGKAAVDAALKMLKDEPVQTNGTYDNGRKQVPSILLTPIPVDKDNIDKVLIDAGYLKREDVYK